MAITTSLASRYWIKTVVMAFLCIILGVWGVYDYVVVIPTAIQNAQRAELQNNFIKDALYVEVGAAERDSAMVALNGAIEKDSGLDAQWAETLVLFQGAIGSSDSAKLREAQDVLTKNLNAYGSVIAPSKYDRPMQWLFIFCIPFGFYYFWAYFNTKKKANTYCLEDNGTLTTPEGTWSSDQIEGIDMERWISKTGKARTTWTAKVIIKGHGPVLLDDFVYRDMHLIIGKLAHDFYPKEWSPLAKRIDSETKTNDCGEEE